MDLHLSLNFAVDFPAQSSGMKKPRHRVRGLIDFESSVGIKAKGLFS